MDIYGAILRAADHIESHPADFDFMEGVVPNGCGTPGCALGWIGHFSQAGHAYHTQVSSRLLDVEPIEFYNRMAELTGLPRSHGCCAPWAKDAKVCAQGLRLYAEKYHKPSALALDPGFIAFRDKLMEHVNA